MIEQGAAQQTVRIVFLSLGGALSAPAFADDEPAPYQPAAPYVPTVHEDVELMLDVAGVGPGDYVIDLGSGDGRIVIAAARRGALGHGVEIAPHLVEESRANAREAGVGQRTAFAEGDIFDAHVADASVVTLYLFPEVNIALRPKLLAELAPGTRVVSNSFDMGDWRPDVHDMSARSSGGILMWIVPADVDGEWQLDILAGSVVAEAEAGVAESAEWSEVAADFAEDEPSVVQRHVLRISQAYQEIDVALQPAEAEATAGIDAEVTTLRGDRIAFHGTDGQRSYAFAGRVNGGSIAGYVQIRDDEGERLLRWRAAR